MQVLLGQLSFVHQTLMAQRGRFFLLEKRQVNPFSVVRELSCTILEPSLPRPQDAVCYAEDEVLQVSKSFSCSQ